MRRMPHHTDRFALVSRKQHGAQRIDGPGNRARIHRVGTRTNTCRAPAGGERSVPRKHRRYRQVRRRTSNVCHERRPRLVHGRGHRVRLRRRGGLFLLLHFQLQQRLRRGHPVQVRGRSVVPSGAA
ncbi:hypothetical protein Kisp01_59630 [Kineosporia sp. NBRC 101677]|nr:hypothetical protein Kisp01_59630 [Kineosporia sp. NBRC 101677]